jgi:hypothetical protein
VIDWLWGDPCQDDDETVPVLFMDYMVEGEDDDEGGES